MKIQYRVLYVCTVYLCMKKIHRNKAHVLMAGYTDLVIFAHVAQARVGEENFQYALRYILHILYIFYQSSPSVYVPRASTERAF